MSISKKIFYSFEISFGKWLNVLLFKSRENEICDSV